MFLGGQQALDVLDVQGALHVPTPLVLDVRLQAPTEELAIDDEIEWDRSRGVEDLVDKAGKLESTP